MPGLSAKPRLGCGLKMSSEAVIRTLSLGSTRRTTPSATNRERSRPTANKAKWDKTLVIVLELFKALGAG